MNAIRQFVRDDERWFRGRSLDSDGALDSVEQALGVAIPEDVRWLLTNYGFWHATGISFLDETVRDTQLARTHVRLPHQFVVLYDHQDGGVILLDTSAERYTGEHKV